MQRRSNQLLFVLFFFLVFCQGAVRAQNFYSGIDPLSNSLQSRQLYYNKRNLVANPSFEGGAGFAHWTVVGKNVTLTDRGADPKARGDAKDKAGVFDGAHAVRISRTYKEVAEVNDTASGVLSDFMEVIPANFDFYFDLRLEKIIPTVLVDRLQTKIDKDVDIHLVFYDKDKKEIDPGVYFDYVGKKVDNGFKGFAFSNYYYIDKFDWARVHGRTWDYPFSEGDLPEGCKYVRIFFGLKCSGTMWVDNVDFRLSRWNFTPLEREDSFFHKKYALSELLMPTPKSVSAPGHIDMRSKTIQIVYEGVEGPETRSAIELLQNRLGQVKTAVIKRAVGGGTVAEGGGGPALSRGLRVVLVKADQSHPSGLDAAFAAIGNKEQGYFIRHEGSTVYLGAVSGVGLYYAASTLSQLVNVAASTLDYADITDYPDFTGRTAQLGTYPNRWQLQQDKNLTDSAIDAILKQRNAGLEAQEKDLDFYAFYKINVLYSNANFTKKWWEPGDFFSLFYKRLGQRVTTYGDIIGLGVGLNPFAQFNKEEQEETLNDSVRNIFAIGSDDGFEKITRALKPALDAGAMTVQLGCDDYVPHAGIIRGEYTLYHPSDKKQFTNLAAAHNFLIDRLKAWLDKNYHNVRLEFIPAPYNNRFIDYGRGSAEMYFKDLEQHLDTTVALVWTGNTVRSLVYDLADIRRATDIYGRKPMIFDNTPYARYVETYNGGYPIHYPTRSPLCNIFEPFDIQYPSDFAAYLDGRYYSNLTASGEINKIKYMTFADFSWNPNAYNPDLSLYKSLVQYVGEANGVLLLKFSQAYFQFTGTWGQLRINLEHDSSFRYTREERIRAEEEIRSLKVAFTALQPIKNGALKKELENLMDAKITAWRKLIQ